MPFDPVAALIDLLEDDGGRWPPKAFEPAWKTVRQWRAFLESDRPALRRLAGWEAGTERQYKVDPLPERIGAAWADFVWGEDPEIAAAVTGEGENATRPDQDRTNEIVEGNDLPDELRSAEETRTGEGEVWWRVAVDPEVSDVPLIEFHSRAVVCPLFIGRRLVACALVSELGKGKGPKSRRYRHFEIHVPGAAHHVLYAGTKARLGEVVDLGEHPDTQGLALLPENDYGGTVWAHGLGEESASNNECGLMGRIINKRGRTADLGVSDFHGIKDFLLDLNEAIAIGAENARLTAKKRITAPASSIALRDTGIVETYDRGDGVRVPIDGQPLDTTRAPARFAAGEDVLVTDPIDEELGGERRDPFKVLEYSFDAQALITYKRDLAEGALTRIGLTPQWVGVVTGDSEGLAISGTALRLRLLPTTKAGNGKVRPWNVIPRVLSLAAQVDALHEDDGGLGNEWHDPEALPTVVRADPLPVDEVEESQVQSTLLTAGARSLKTAVKAQHPRWTDDEIEAEVDAIREERKTSGPSLGFGGPA